MVAREISEHLSECWYRSPSLLMLDDLDTLCKGSEEGEEGRNWSEETHLARLRLTKINWVINCTLCIFYAA